MVTAAGGKAVKQADRVAIEYQLVLRGTPIQFLHLLRKLKSDSRVVLKSLYSSSVSY